MGLTLTLFAGPSDGLSDCLRVFVGWPACRTDAFTFIHIHNRHSPNLPFIPDHGKQGCSETRMSILHPL